VTVSDVAGVSPAEYLLPDALATFWMMAEASKSSVDRALICTW